MTVEKSVRRRFSIWRVLLLLALLYVGGYFVLMDRTVPAVRDLPKVEGSIMFFSSFRWAKQLHGWPVQTYWNNVFQPLDRIYFSVFPCKFKMDQQMY